MGTESIQRTHLSPEDKPLKKRSGWWMFFFMIKSRKQEKI